MDQEYKFGLIMPNMKVNGVKIKQMAVENSGMLMAIFMKVNGKMIKLMVTEFTFMLMEPNMRGIGKMIFKMAKAWRAGKMAVDMKVDIKKA